MPKVTFECEVDLPADGLIAAVELRVMNPDREWESVLLFAFARPQKARDGKHLKISEKFGKVVKVGKIDANETGLEARRGRENQSDP